MIFTISGAKRLRSIGATSSNGNRFPYLPPRESALRCPDNLAKISGYVYLPFFILVLNEKEKAVAHTPENLPGQYQKVGNRSFDLVRRGRYLRVAV